MLSPPDHDLVRRDPLLPGLRSLFDAEAFTSLLHAALPALREASARPIYVRYKPGTRCLVAYAVEGAGTVAYVHANAYSRPRWRERSKAASPWQVDRSVDPLYVAVDDIAVAISCFPRDEKLPALRRLCDSLQRPAVLRKLAPRCPSLHASLVETLAYKPGRRYVGLLRGDNARAVVKLYGEGVSESARTAARHLQSIAPLRVAPCIGRSRRHRALLFEWLPGERLSDIFGAGRFEAGQLRQVGAALAELHRQLRASAVGQVPQDAYVLEAVARGVAILCPSLAGRVTQVARSAAAAVRAIGTARQPIHGDFYAGQVVIDDDGAGILDLDRAAWGEPVVDIGNFAAHLEYDVIDGTLSAPVKEAATAALLEGYEARADVSSRDRVRLHTAAGLLRLADGPFRTRASGWDDRITTILDRVDTILSTASVAPRTIEPRPEPVLPPGALDAGVVERHLSRLPRLQAGGGDIRVRAVRVVRHKPGRRTLIEYDVEAHGAGERFTVVGKVRAKGADVRTCHLVEALWSAGFQSGTGDGISVPEPLGVITHLKMWLQRKVPGTVAAELLDEAGAPIVCRRAADVLHKLHRAGVEPVRRHSVDDELRILDERLSRLAADRPSWSSRLTALLDACHALMHAIPPFTRRGIHRDFHPGQLLLHGDRVYLLDLDLYAAGDPALDVGNFLAHVAEYSLRRFGDPDRLAAAETALVNRYLELAPDVASTSIDSYRTLSLVRHVQISTLFYERRPFTERILDYCESRLRLAVS